MNEDNLETLIQESVTLAEKWQNRSNALLTPGERIFQNQMRRLLSHSTDKVILARMIDQSFRSKKTDRVADQINSLFKRFGVPAFFSKFEQLLTHLFFYIGRHISIISIPLMIMIIRRESRRVILPGEKEALFSHLKKRKADGVRMNINHLGEAVLGEDEALSRLNTYLEDLKDPEVAYISVKISTIYSQIDSIAFEHTVRVLKERLSQLYRAAQSHFHTMKNGDKIPKFVNLDMEEYSDLHITAIAFTQTLDLEEFKRYSAGIVLQSYLPDSFEMQKKLTLWAKNRVADGGSPIKIRIVKGANMEMEKVESSIRNWPLATYDNKPEVDANYKRMVEYGMRPENIQAVNLGIASHNLFELAFAYKLAEERNVFDCFSFEMLEGMADHVRRAIQETSTQMLLYAPVAAKDQFINAIAYLIRRLDENTARENFLRYACDLKTGSQEWDFLKTRFIDSCRQMTDAGDAPHRSQDRSVGDFDKKSGMLYDGQFINEPDTDWSLSANRKWAKAVREKWEKGPDDKPVKIPLVVAGSEIFENQEARDCFDLSKISAKPAKINAKPAKINAGQENKICVASCALANQENVKAAVDTAKKDPDGWRDTSLEERHQILSKLAAVLRQARGDLIGSAAATTGKVFVEADVEVSEAIDFAEYYPYSLKRFNNLKSITCTPKGVGLVISPWNFPIAIPCGGIVAALAAGNTVIFKPASSAVLPAWQLCKCFWKAGISKKVLQFLPCSGAETGASLTMHKDVDFIIFTGGTDTGLEILKRRSDIYFAGETGGKNATIVTAMSDRDQAIKNVIHSAFSNCGQKCSATSLLILEKEVYNDSAFKAQLKDAAKSYSTGSAWAFENRMGPLISPPGGKLKDALTQLESREQWLLEPENIDNNPYLWTPGIKWGVKPGSKTHMTEFFGPVLGVMCAANLEQAIWYANQTGYGLTSGLESLDRREQEYWKSRIKAGNLYINRGTTGAVVLRQAFGGMGKSAIGAGIKAGGPNYVVQFTDIANADFPDTDAVTNDHWLLQLCMEWQQKIKCGRFQIFEDDLRKTILAVKSYLYAKEQEFARPKDYFHLKGQDNIIRYLPIGAIVVRIHDDDSLFEILARIAAANISGARPIISMPRDIKNPHSEFLFQKEGENFIGKAEIVHQSDEELIGMMPDINTIRYAAPGRVPDAISQAAADRGFYIARTKVVMEGRLELLQYFQEQSICDNYHRYGNLMERSMD